nr:putative transcription factor WD40-like family [Ipomoea batatas]
MDGRRITASPRPCSGRRVVAKKRTRSGIDGFVNSVKKLQRREISSKRDRAFSMSDAQERFRNIRLQEEYDTHDPKGHCAMVLPFLKKRSKIIEIVAACDIVFALAQSGICAAFSRETNKRICFLNVSPDEVIRSLFYNKNNDSLITVSVYALDNFSSLKCRTTRIDIYKVFDLKNYTMLYSISDKNVQEIKISPGIMLLIFNKASCYVPLKILSIEDGTVLKSFNHMLHRNKKVDFIEQFNEKLLVKQENENLQILDVRNSELTEVSRTEFMTPSAFIFLYENQLFLTFRNRTVAVWNFRGELVTSFEDHLLWHPDCNTNNIYITSDQDLIISYCKADSYESLSEGTAGSINISNILTGKCLAKIKATDDAVTSDDCSCTGRCGGRSCKSKHVQASRIRSTVAEALDDITALFYDEERNEIYTGNRSPTALYRSPSPDSSAMFRHTYRFVARANAMRWRRPFCTKLAADATFVEAWKKTIPNVDPPQTPSAYMAPRPATPSSIPSKLTVNFVLPYSSELAGKEVDMVIIPANTGQMGVLPGHVASVAELKPGVMSVHEGNDVTKYFLSGGFAFIHANSIADIIAVEAVPLDQIDANLVQKGLTEFTQKPNSASTDIEKAEAQIGVDVHSALNSALTG